MLYWTRMNPTLVDDAFVVDAFAYGLRADTFPGAAQIATNEFAAQTRYKTPLVCDVAVAPPTKV